MIAQALILILTLTQIEFSFADGPIQGPILELPTGQIQGRLATTSEDKSYYAFQKIPYAKPPVGELRFQPPQPPEVWEGVLDATSNDVQCYQLGMQMAKSSSPGPFPGGTQSEDCLFINVYTPKLPSSEDEELLPVMLFIHGGGFTEGSGADAKPDLFINNDVVLASINYRLGVFGFISTQDEVIPGNNGLKDQLQAIQWAHDNIALFGGDPSKITIFGQSAGAGSCAHHVLNEKSASLLNGVILESGTFLCPGMFQRDSRRIAFGTGSVLNSTFADSEDSQALYEFLLTLDADDLSAAASEFRNQYVAEWDNFLETGSIFSPVIEPENPDAFLTEKMYVLLKNGNVGAVPTMMGFCAEEKAISAQQVSNLAPIFDEHLEYTVHADMQITDLDARKEMGVKIRDIYTGGETWAEHLGALTRFGSDNFLGRSMIRHAELFSPIASTYFFQFSFVGNMGGPGPGPSTSTFADDPDVAGTVGHGCELNYLFCSGDDCYSDSLSEEDALTRRRMIELWTNFGKYQNPTPESSDLLQNVSWPKVSTEDGDFFYLNIGDDLQVMNHPKEATYQKWVNLYDSLGYDDFDTY